MLSSSKTNTYHRDSQLNYKEKADIVSLFRLEDILDK